MYQQILMEFYFPIKEGIQYEKLQLASNSKYSITKPKDANQIQNIINKIIPKNNLVILDGTANVGGDTIHFGLNPNVKKVISIEKNKDTFLKLINNINVYQIGNKVKAYNYDIVDVIRKCADNIHFDILFLDAPWGGIHYKKHRLLDLPISGRKLAYIVKDLNKCENIDYIFLKVPYNYNLYDLIEKSNYEYIQVYKIETGTKFYMILVLKNKHN